MCVHVCDSCVYSCVQACVHTRDAWPSQDCHPVIRSVAPCRVLVFPVFTARCVYSAKLSSHFFGGKVRDGGFFIQNDSSMHAQDAGWGCLLGYLQASLSDMESPFSNHCVNKWQVARTSAWSRASSLQVGSRHALWSSAFATWRARRRKECQNSGTEDSAPVITDTRLSQTCLDFCCVPFRTLARNFNWVLS